MTKDEIQEYIEANYDEIKKSYIDYLRFVASEIEEENRNPEVEITVFETWAENEAINSEADKIDRLRDERKEQ